MEKRKIYIITTLIVLALLTGLALWYAYVVKQEVLINTTQDIDSSLNINTPLSQRRVDSTIGKDTNTTVFGSKYGEGTLATSSTSTTLTLATTTNDILVPETWSLLQVHTEPVLGTTVVDGQIKYMDSKTGNMLTAATSTLVESSATTETLYNVRSSYMLPNDHVLIVPYDDMPYITKYSDTGSLSEEPTIIYDDILQVVQTDSTLYYTTPNNRGGIDIKSVLFKDLQKDPLPTKQVWGSVLSNWVVQATDSSVYVTQGAGYNMPGYSYLLSEAGDNMIPLVRDLPALMVNLSPNGKTVLYSTINSKGADLYLQDVGSGTITKLYTNTLASKCAWGSGSTMLYCAVPESLPSKNMPESWYKGITHLTDSVWRIDTQSGDAVELVQGTSLDIVELHIVGSTLVFKNKTDQTLWGIIKD